MARPVSRRTVKDAPEAKKTEAADPKSRKPTMPKSGTPKPPAMVKTAAPPRSQGAAKQTSAKAPKSGSATKSAAPPIVAATKAAGASKPRQPSGGAARSNKPTTATTATAKPSQAKPSRTTSEAADPSKGSATSGTGALPRSTEIKRFDPSGDVKLGFLSDYVGFHLRLAQDASYRAFARHRDKDLIKPGRFPALAIIHLNPGISQSALGRAIARDKSTVSPLIKDLQKNGFISRKPSTQDRRSVTLSLTKKGERILDRLHVRAKEHEDEIDRMIGTSKSRLMAMLEKIIGGLAARQTDEVA